MHIRSLMSALMLVVIAGAPRLAAAEDLGRLPTDITFVISGGSWEDPGEADTNGIVKSPQINSKATKQNIRRGYYRLLSVRQPDRTAKVFLQQMQVTETGIQPVDTVELQEINDLHAYVTDIRTDDTSGINSSLGFMGTVYVKTDPKSVDPDSWNVIIDEFGEIQVMRESH
jgi:hypothetical protein